MSSFINDYDNIKPSMDYYDFWLFVNSNYKVAEYDQNKLNTIRYKALYPPSTYQTTSGFSHNANNSKSL